MASSSSTIAVHPASPVNGFRIRDRELFPRAFAVCRIVRASDKSIAQEVMNILFGILQNPKLVIDLRLLSALTLGSLTIEGEAILLYMLDVMVQTIRKSISIEDTLERAGCWSRPSRPPMCLFV